MPREPRTNSGWKFPLRSTILKVSYSLGTCHGSHTPTGVIMCYTLGPTHHHNRGFRAFLKIDYVWSFIDYVGFQLVTRDIYNFALDWIMREVIDSPLE